MDLQPIMDELHTLTPGVFPEEAAREAIARREEVTPLLLEALEQVAADPESLADPEFTLPMHALFLLAQFREPRAWTVILRLFGKTGEDGQKISVYTGDFAPEYLSRVLPCVYDGNLTPLKEIITNPGCDEWVRGAGLRTMVRLVVDGRLTVEEVEKIFCSLLRGDLPRKVVKGEDGEVWNSLASCCCDLRLAGLLDDLLQACREELINPEYITSKEMREEMRQPLNMADLRLGYELPITDATAEMWDWPCFSDPEWGSVDADAAEDEAAGTEGELGTTAPPAAPKVGRNDPCRCGSGMKFKKCCGR